MKFMNSNYGYANFAKKSSRTSGGTSRRPGGNEAANSKRPGRTGNTPAPKVTTTPFEAAKPQSTPSASTSSGQRINTQRGYNASDALSPAYGPQPLVGPQQKKGGFGKAMDSVRGKGQYYGAKAKNTLAKAGRFIGRNKVGVGLAAAGALGAGIGATALIRKMRSDKGKKRGRYSK